MVSDNEAAHVTVIFCQEAGIVSLKGIERFPNLRVLNCIRNHISSLDLSANRALETLWCHDNPLIELDVSGCEGLTELDCRGWGLRRLDVSGCSSLEALDCGDNALTSLDLEGCRSLRRLSCGKNGMSGLVLRRNGQGSNTSTACRCRSTRSILSECPRLREAYIGGARLAALDLERKSLSGAIVLYGLRSEVFGRERLLRAYGAELFRQPDRQPDGGTAAGFGGAQLQFQRSRLARTGAAGPGSR